MLAALIAFLVIPVVEGGKGPAEPTPWAAPWDGQSFRPYRDAAAGVSFEVPFSGFLLESRHFDADAAAGTARHILTLSGPNGPEVTVDVWVDARGSDLARWFEVNLAFMRDAETSIASVVVSKQRAGGMLLSQPRSGQSFGRESAVFAFGGRVFRVTCLDKDDVRARKVFERVLETFDAGAAP